MPRSANVCPRNRVRYNLRNQFHIDHIFPTSTFTDRKLKDLCVPEHNVAVFRDRKDRLANLQLLQGSMNTEKSATMPAEWLSETYADEASRHEYEENHLLGHVPESITAFGTFYDVRRERLKRRIGQLLGRQPSI